MGVGVKDVDEVWKWYRKYFGMDVFVFMEKVEVGLMFFYIGG